MRSISADVSHYTVLFGLENSNSVECKGNKLHLKHRVYTPSENLSEKLDLLCQDVADLIHSVDQNVFEKPDIPNLHLTTVFDNICIDRLPQVRDWILDQGSQFQHKIRNFLAKLDKDSNPRLYKRPGGGRVVVGTFSLTEQILKKERHE